MEFNSDIRANVHNGCNQKEFAASDIRHKSVTYSWNKVNVYAKKQRGTFFRSSNEIPQEKHILKDVTGICRPGEFLAIMGASGAGKTTLLNVLNARSGKELRVEGNLYVNGEKMDTRKLATQSAYIQQDDLFIGTCTVKEQLVFHALLRMDTNVSRKKRMERVEEVMQEMCLNKCRNTLIGIPGRLKGISGGEKKRLAFACEVLTDPPLLFCDEPTTGLDSFMAQTIVSAMKTLASEGRGVICTIHQPSSEVFAMFDRLLLMADGQVAYLGDVSKAPQFFSSIGRPLPLKYNPADFYVSSLAVKTGREDETKTFASDVCDAFQSSEDFKTLEKVVQDNMVHWKTESRFVSRSFRSRNPRESPYKANRWEQLKALSRRTFIEMKREPYILRTKIIQTIIISLLIGVIYFDQDDYYDQDKVSNVNGALFLLITQISMNFYYGVLRTFCTQLPVFSREHYSGMYSVDTFYLTKNLSELPLSFLLSFGYLIVIYFMVNIDRSVSSFFSMVLVLILLSNCALSFGYLIASIGDDLQTSLTIAAPLIVPMMMFGGFFINSDTCPLYFLWIKYMSWFHYGFEALIITQWKDVQYINYTSPQYDFKSGLEVIEGYGCHIDNWTLDICLLLLLIVTYRTIGFLILLRKTYTRRK